MTDKRKYENVKFIREAKESTSRKIAQLEHRRRNKKKKSNKTNSVRIVTPSSCKIKKKISGKLFIKAL